MEEDHVSIKNIAIADATALLIIFLLPTIYHILPFPGYYMEPMRIALFSSFLISKNKYNTYLMAVTIPVLTMIVSGHPPFFKMILICFELLLNSAILIFIFKSLKGSMRIFIGFLLSIFISKGLYYVLKYLFIKMAFIDGSLVTISLWIQLLVAVILSLIFSIMFIRTNNKFEP